MKLKKILTGALIATVSLAVAGAAPIKIAYSDWPGWTVLEIAKQKGWFKDAGLDVELDWFDYSPSMRWSRAQAAPKVNLSASQITAKAVT